MCRASYKSSSTYEYPDIFGEPDFGPEDQINVDILSHSIGIPLTVYIRPYESGKNAILIIGKLETLITLHEKASNEEYGEVVYKGTDIDSQIRTNVGIGVGYQRQLDRYIFLNIYPSFNVDIRANHPFNSITLTAEILFGVY